MPRRHLFAATIPFWTACEPAPKSTETSAKPYTPEVPASLILEDWNRATLTLVDPGTEPRSVLRAPVATPGEPVMVQWETVFETTAKRGVTTTVPSKVRQKRLLRIVPSAGTPTATLDFIVVEASERVAGGPPPSKNLEQELVSRTGRWRSTERCEVMQAGIDSSGADAARPHLPGLLRSAAESCPILPGEAVGIGARWTTTETTTSGDERVTEWVLTTLNDTQASVTFQSSEGPDTLAEGRVGLDRAHMIPNRFDATGRTVRKRRDPSSPNRSIRWTTTWEMHAERKADMPRP
ncbi:MAG TPA: hypothetical protein DFR83_17965 [Deltaproteobacteria bacterium]|nr:hypothetical protein [Deltaproteobacteria bacterium]